MLCHHTESAFTARLPRIGARVRNAARTGRLRIRRTPVIALCFLGFLSVFTSAGWGGVGHNESRAEAQALHWLGRALPDTGLGLKELHEGIQKFEEQNVPAALGSFNEARRLGTGTRVEEAAVFLAAECLARTAEGAQDLRAAIVGLDESRRRYPHSLAARWALWRVGSLYVRQGFQDEAVARYEQLLRDDPASNPLTSFIRLDLADVYIVQGRYEQAAKILRVVRRYPPDVDSLGQATVGLGDMAHVQGQYRQAKELYELAELQWPQVLHSRPVSLFGMGDTYLRLGDWPRALHLLNTGYGLHPRAPIAPMMLVRMADGLKLHGRIHQAEAMYQTVVERYPGTDGELSSLLGLGRLAETEALAGAPEAEVRTIFGAIVKRWNTNIAAAEALLHLAQSYQRTGSLEEAIATYNQLLDRGDSGPWRVQGRQGLEMMLRGLSAAGEIVEVANLFLRHKALLTTPTVNGPTGLLIAGALTRLGLVDLTITLTQAALAAGVPDAQREYGMVALAEAYRRKGDLLHQEQSWKAYLRKYPQGTWAEEAREGVVMALARAGKQKEAQTTCENYLYTSTQRAKGTGSQAVVRLCADRFAQGGNLKSAQDLYREILKNEPAPEEAVWANYQIARASHAANHSVEARGLFEEVSKTDKDALLALAASAQLTQLTASEKR